MRYVLITIIVLVTGCSSQKDQATTVTVESIGALREIMHQAKYQARAKLDTIAEKALYGLGASDSLSGEIMMMDGEVFESTVQDSQPKTQINPSAEATLLVYAKVSKWDTLNVKPDDTLEKLVDKYAKEHKLKAPFPFIILGEPHQLSYHIINFDAENGSIANHKAGSYQGKIKNEGLTILGFYATDAKGVYTHHDSNLHMHVLNERKTQMGHVEDISWGENDIQLLIPRI